MRYKTLIIGTGGLAKQLEFHYDKGVVFLDSISKAIIFNSFSVIKDISETPLDTRYFVVAVADPMGRKALTQKAKTAGLTEQIILAEDVHIPYSSEIKDNCIVLRGCLVETMVKIGYGSLINTKVSLHHDVKLGEYVTIGPGATLLGNVTVGNNSFIGAGAIIREKTSIGHNCIVGMGSVVTKDIPSNQMWYGNPARFVEDV